MSLIFQFVSILNKSKDYEITFFIEAVAGGGGQYFFGNGDPLQ